MDTFFSAEEIQPCVEEVCMIAEPAECVPKSQSLSYELFCKSWESPSDFVKPVYVPEHGGSNVLS